MCEALGVSRGGFYAWRVRPQSRRGRENEALTIHIRRSFSESDSTYGSPRVFRDGASSAANIESRG
jgi:putative transposase